MNEKQPPTRVVPGHRLGQLLAEYDRLKPAADEIATQLKSITDAIKLESTTAAPDAEEIELVGSRLRLVYQESWRLDSARMKKEAPETYVRWAKKSGAWYLKAA